MIRPGKAVVVATAIALGSACKGDGAAPGPGSAPASKASPAATPEIDGRTPLPDPLPEVAATVNGAAIPTRNVQRLAEQALQSGSFPPDQKALVYRRALQQFIVRELLLQEAMARQVKPEDRQLEQMENTARSRYKDEAQFRAALAEGGMDEATFKSELRAQATADALVNALRQETPPTSVSDADVQKFYDDNPREFTSTDRVRAAHILIRVPPGTGVERKTALRGKAEQALKEIQAGTAFGKVAAKFSEDNSTKDRDGEMDAYGGGQMPPELADLDKAIRSLKPGAVSDIVETRAGFHVAKLLERLPDEKVPFESVKDQVRHHLLNQKRHEALQAFVNQLRAKAKIETHL